MGTNRVLQGDFFGLFVADGTTDGIVTLNNNLGIYPNAIGWIRSSDAAVGSLQVIVSEIIGFTQIRVKSLDNLYGAYSDISTWLLADDCTISFPQQPVTFGSMEQFRMISDHSYAFMAKAGLRPDAEEAFRSHFWNEKGGVLEQDVIQSCLKLDDDTYAWVNLLAVTGMRIQGTMGTISSANSLSLGVGNYFVIEGDTQINLINSEGWTAGSRVMLEFDSDITIRHEEADSGDYKSIRVSGGAHYVAAAGHKVEVVWNGTYWALSPFYVP